MREFFRDCRQKIGVITLVLAIVFAGAWARSFHTGDHCDLIGMYGSHVFWSESGVVYWSRSRGGNSGFAFDWYTSKISPPTRPTVVADEDSTHCVFRLEDFYDFTWRWNVADFDFAYAKFGSFGGPPIRIVWWKIPYWSLVIPLTLLSAYLLLFKPRPKQQQNQSDNTLSPENREKDF